MLRKKLLKMFGNELEKICAWNKKTFPEATLAGQLEKLEEEWKEFTQCSNLDEHRCEFADVFIVLAGLRRWKSLIGCFFENTLIDDMTDEMIVTTLRSIEEKMKINYNRKWVRCGKGIYRHAD